MTPQPVIDVTDVVKTYAGRNVVDGISFRVERGEFFGILGPNGAGKTTLVEMVEGLRTPDSGTVQVLGSSPADRDHTLLPRLGVQTQKGAFFTRLTCREHLVTMAALYGVPPTTADRTLASVGLADHGHTRTERLSGGQRQRLSIASALVHDPDVIFLDEPTAALDPQARRDLWSLLRELKAAGRSIVYTTHHMDEAEALCDRVAIMVAGRVQALGSPHELKLGGTSGTRILVPIGKIDLAAAQLISHVQTVTEEGGSVVLTTTSPSEVLLELNAMCGLDGIETRTTTLEDVYLELTTQEAVA